MDPNAPVLVLSRALIAAGFDAEPFYSGGGIEVVHIITRRGDPRPVTRLGKPTGETYRDPLDYLAIGDGSYPDAEPFGFDVFIDGEYAEGSSGYVQDIRADDAPAIAAWLTDNLSPLIEAANTLSQDDCDALGLDGRDGTGEYTLADLSGAQRVRLYAYRYGIPDDGFITPLGARGADDPRDAEED